MARKERRQSTRVHFHTTASLYFGKEEFSECETADLSIKGVLVRNVGNVEVGEHCGVLLHLTGASSELILRMQGVVVRKESNGVAIKFEEIDLDSFYHLRNIVYYNSDHPDELEEEFIPDLGEDEFEDGFR